MKMILFICLSLVFFLPAVAQLKTKPVCPEFVVDVLDGKVSGIRPDVTTERIKILLPCYSSTAGENDTAKCGSNVFYKDQDVFFYTARDYVRIGPKYKGKFTFPIMGMQRNSLFKWLGNAKIKDVSWDAYQTNYGCLILYFDSTSKVNMIQFSTLSTDAINLCE